MGRYVYEGQFREGLFHGYGRQIEYDGEIYEGMWEDGQQHGYGKAVNVFDEVNEGLFEYGEFKEGKENLFNQ